MVKVTYQQESYEVVPGMSVLEALEQNGVEILTSCRSGTCQTCKKKAVQGSLPAQSQTGLKPTEQAQGYFMPCVCYPSEDLVIEDLDQVQLFQSQVISVKPLNQDIAEVQLASPDAYQYYPGQYIQVFKEKNLCRSYSLSSLPRNDEALTLHVKLVANGRVSPWVHQLKPGDALQISSAAGNCFYQAESLDQPLLLLGTGSGLSPLYGILREALAAGHQGEIWLFQGAMQATQLYYQEKLRALEQQFPQFHYFPCVVENAPADCQSGSVVAAALKKVPSLKGFKIFLAGAPDIVKQASLKMFLAGASMNNIYKDPFG